MWTLIIPLVLPFEDQAEHRIEFATREQCHAARIELIERVRAAERAEYSGAYESAAAERFANIDAADQPPGWPSGWAYANRAEIGYCVSGPSRPEARGENLTG